MKRKIIIISLLVSSFLLWGETSIWKIKADESTFFLGGTIHILSKSDYPLPQEFNQIFDDSDILVLEADMGAMTTPEFQQEMLTSFTLPQGITVKDQLSESVFNSLASHLADLDLPVEPFLGFKPNFLALTLTALEWQRLGIDAPGVDQHFYALAKSAGKNLVYLETPEQQLNFISSMGAGQEDELISSTLNEIHTVKESMVDMTLAWREGDYDRLMKFFVKELKVETPELYESLLVARNNAWMPQIEQMAATPEVEFILVGAAHLVGEDGLIEKCKALGFEVEQL